MGIYLSLHPEKIENGTGYNVADARAPWTSRQSER
jgi:hypothetical protein